jgi:endonuclease/exonuclease/phosphatase (EEP) superfamily protein YafD
MNGWQVFGAVLLAGCAGGDPPSTTGMAPPPGSGRAPVGAGAGGTTARDPAAELLVMTYNLNFGVAGDEETIELIRGSGADVVFLQETNETWERAIRQALPRIYPHMAFRHGERRAGGLGFLSRHPLAAREYERSPIGWFPAWRALLDGPLGRIQLLNLHLRPPGRDGGSYIKGYMTSQEPRLEEMRAHARLLDPSLPAIVAGDFNEDADGRSIRFLAERGLASALPRFQRYQPTWRWQTRMGEVRWQLDHIVVDPALEATAAWVIDGGASDHLPLLARIARSKARGRTNR